MEIVEQGGIKVSVIIPMHNVAKFLHRSVNSLYSQDLYGIELIFVDDCSTDNTLTVLQSLLQDKEGVKVSILHHDANQGVAAARNTALDVAVGEYIYYVDADDYIEPNTLSTLYNSAKSNNADIVGCDWFLTFEKNERRMYQPSVKDGVDAFKKMAKGVMRTFLCVFLVRRSVYENNNLRFIPHQDMCEDMMLMMKAVLLVERIVMVHTPLYHYIQSNQNSLTKKYKVAKNQIENNIYSVEQFLQRKGHEDLRDYIRLLELTLKHPFLISSKQEDYKCWQEWFPDSNNYIGLNDESCWYTRLLQYAGKYRCYFVLKLYHWLFIYLYGKIYK